jgi:hypothetical protein
MNTNIRLWQFLAHFLLEGEIFQIKFVEKTGSHISCWIIIHEDGAIYKIMWKNTVGPDCPLTTIWRMSIVCWMSKATVTHSKYVVHNASHGNNGYTNAPHCYVIRKLPVLLTYEDVSGCCTYWITFKFRTFWYSTVPYTFVIVFPLYGMNAMSRLCISLPQQVAWGRVGQLMLNIY